MVVDESSQVCREPYILKKLASCTPSSNFLWRYRHQRRLICRDYCNFYGTVNVTNRCYTLQLCYAVILTPHNFVVNINCYTMQSTMVLCYGVTLHVCTRLNIPSSNTRITAFLYALSLSSNRHTLISGRTLSFMRIKENFKQTFLLPS